MNDCCQLFKMIPKNLLNELFENSHASAELDYTFLCFEDIYLKALEVITSDTVVIDLGCAYATQSWFFKDCKKYIGIDCAGDEKSVIHTKNSEYYFMDIQKFIRERLPILDIDLDNVFAVCSAVPDDEARQMVLETFPYHLVYYPGGIFTMKTLDKVSMTETVYN